MPHTSSKAHPASPPDSFAEAWSALGLFAALRDRLHAAAREHTAGEAATTG
ncbi:hypothetical protein OG361_08005 [Streptomyces sp. NBC_00090]|uniref:hypothetical protein n=1 Tax=Streptomyces sp. NBC_00090 TaxID=2903619 RepID=UPI0032460ED7